MSHKFKIGLLMAAGLIVVVILILFVSVQRYGIKGTSYNYAMNESDSTSGLPGNMVNLGSGRGEIARDEVPKAASQIITPDGELDSTAQERLIIKTGELSMVVSDVRDSAQKISNYAVEKGGFVVDSNISKSNLTLYGTVIVRIPVAVFDQAQEDVKAMGEVTSQRTSGQDVTEEYVDLDAQLRNLRVSEEQFLQIMKRAEKVEDILAVQRELTWVRQDIERIQGSMKYLEQSADLSTLTVYLSTDPNKLPVVDDDDQWKPWAQVKKAMRSLLGFGQGLVTVVIWFVVYIPLWIVAGAVIWVIVRMVRRRKDIA